MRAARRAAIGTALPARFRLSYDASSAPGVGGSRVAAPLPFQARSVAPIARASRGQLAGAATSQLLELASNGGGS